MSNILTRDAAAMHRALAGSGDDVHLTVSRETAEWLASIVDARSQGHQVVVSNTRDEVTPAEAARILGVSRPQIRKFMDEGKLGFRMVGSHHRIPLTSIDAFKEWERKQMSSGMETLENCRTISHFSLNPTEKSSTGSSGPAQ